MLTEQNGLRDTHVMEAFIVEINAWAWGVPMQVLLLGTGIFLTLGLGFLTWRRLGFAFRLLLGGFKGQGEGDIPPFRALMTSLSATIGTGNIAGVATRSPSAARARSSGCG